MLYLQDVDPDVPVHNSRRENTKSRSSIYHNAGTQQHIFNPEKTRSVPGWNADGWCSIWPDESNFPFHMRRAIFDDASEEGPISPQAEMLEPNLYAHMSSLSPVTQFRRETSKTTPVPQTTKRPATATIDGEQSRKRAKTRIGLPLTLNANSGPATVLACPDTGSEENIISLDLAQALGYNILNSHCQNRTFALANGSIVEAVGEIIAECSFGMETTPTTVPMTLAFYVFMKLASPIIMGLAFLEQTETMSKHRDRLLRVPRPAYQPIQVYSVGRPRNQLYCYLNNSYVPAIPDSGSELNLMTRSFASRNGLHIKIAKEVVEFADGTIAVTSGVVRTKLSIRKDQTRKYRTIPTADFYLMDDLRHDLIVGEDSLEKLKIFTKGQHTLFPSPYTIGPAGLSRIHHLGAVGDVLSWVKKKISLIRRPHGVSSSTQVLPNDSLADQRENDRREREEIRIANLPVDQREGAIAAEALKQAQYGNTAGGP